ncbi:MFS transporter [Aliidiomarina sedimenti]|uniref:MFS transporter n=1 Tax=Aliidiomarina sedimenti TaxID=1933879 RepID=A0ABY0BXU3_9GAMM|nr:MFS transporter [Aliidiomarina sedimenti]
MTSSFLPKRLDPVLVISLAQLFGTSLWFSANSAGNDLMQSLQLTPTGIGWLTSAVQAGFVLGTLVVALSGIADRWRASTIFVASAIAGALFNVLFAWFADGLSSALILRFLVGLSLAGIYPIGMKLVVSWAPERTGAALAQLLAMLVLGTALPHGLREVGADLPWQWIITASSVLALFAALLIHLLGDGPYANGQLSAPTKAQGKPLGVMDAFRIRGFRAAAVGYFGHMWELYAFWTLVPLLLARSRLVDSYPMLSISLMSFAIIAMGAIGCLLGGSLSKRVGSARVALSALACSGICALIFALGWRDLPELLLALLLLVWGASVSADSPQFSSMSAQACPPQLVGTALAIQNSIGFAITMVSIAAAMALFEHVGIDAVWLLVPGPVLGLAGYMYIMRR